MGFQQDLKPALGIETAFGSVSVCVIDAINFEPIAVQERELQLNHAESLAPLIRDVVRSTGLSFSGLGRVAVSIGPGSFTGVRVGLSAARAIGLVTGVDVVGISTLSSFAAPFLGDDSSVLVSVVEARDGLVYFQGFDRSGATRMGPAIGSVRNMLSMLDLEPITFVGSAARRVGHEAKLSGKFVADICQTYAPSVVDVARLGALSSSVAFPPRPNFFEQK